MDYTDKYKLIQSLKREVFDCMKYLNTSKHFYTYGSKREEALILLFISPENRIDFIPTIPLHDRFEFSIPNGTFDKLNDNLLAIFKVLKLSGQEFHELLDECICIDNKYNLDFAFSSLDKKIDALKEAMELEQLQSGTIERQGVKKWI